MMVESFLNLRKDMNLQMENMERTPNQITPKRSTPKHTIIKLSKDKDREC